MSIFLSIMDPAPVLRSVYCILAVIQIPSPKQNAPYTTYERGCLKYLTNVYPIKTVVLETEIQTHHPSFSTISQRKSSAFPRHLNN